MPARVHALLVVRPDGRLPVDLHFSRTLAALAAQTRPVDAVTIVMCGSDPAGANGAIENLARESGAEGIIAASASTSYADALRLATPRIDGDVVWLLAQDTAPDPEALARLTAALETAPSVVVAVAKLVRWDDARRIVSFGETLTSDSRVIGLADGEHDQGQYDATEDILGGDVRGMLVRTEAWRALAGLDGALAGADEGLDVGVRARLAGGRVALAPEARIAVPGDGVAGLPAPTSFGAHFRIAYAQRRAHLHRRMVYPAAVIAFLQWLSIIPRAVGRTIAHLVGKRPGLIAPEWAAAAAAVVGVAPVVRARGGIRSTKSASWAQLAPLRASRSQLRERLDDDPGAEIPREGWHFFTGGGAWVVLGALVTAIAAFPALLAWPALGGGALAPLAPTLGQLWGDAAWGQRALGWAHVGPADPFAGVIALVGSLAPLSPSRALVVVWVLALPLAALGGWFAATRVSSRAWVRAVGAVVWALAPTFLTALTQGRPAAVLLHLVLPWLLFTGAVAHRSWSNAGAASLLLVAASACAPSLLPAFVLIGVVMVVIAVASRGGVGIARIVWVFVPTLIAFAPLAWSHLRRGDLLSLFADPALAWAGPQVAPSASGRALLLSGFPTDDPAGWAHLLGGTSVWWVPLLLVPLALCALASLMTARWATGAIALFIAAAGAVTAFIAVGVTLTAIGAQTVALWPGTALSLAWAGALAAALTALDVIPARTGLRAGASLVVIGALAVCVFPLLTSGVRGTALLANGPASTLPAYVTVEGRGTPENGTIVIAPHGDGSIATTVVWGGTETLGGQSTFASTRTKATADDIALGSVTADLVSDSAADVVARIAAHGIGYVLLASPPDDETSTARSMRLSATRSLDQRGDLENVGNTDKGVLWRVTATVADRAPLTAAERSESQFWVALQGVALAVAVLLAVPTRSSRRAARGSAHVVGAGSGGTR